MANVPTTALLELAACLDAEAFMAERISGRPPAVTYATALWEGKALALRYCALALREIVEASEARENG